MPSNDSLMAILSNGVQALGSLTQVIARVFPQATTTSTSATGGTATALPSQPAGYLNISLPDGTSAKVPFYR